MLTSRRRCILAASLHIPALTAAVAAPTAREAAALSGDCRVSDEAGLGLLQLAAGGARAARAIEDPGAAQQVVGEHTGLADLTEDAKNQRLQNLKPLVWIHIPKTGSSLINTFASTQGLCPDFPEEGYFTEDVLGPHLFGEEQLHKYYTNERYCPGAFNSIGWTSTHTGVGNFPEEALHGHIVAMFRQPEQRLVSAYNYFFHSWPKKLFGRDPHDLHEYAEVTSGCGVKLFTRPGTACYDPAPPTEAEVALALKRLQTDTAFVGLTDEWDLSVCLWHAMYGSNCKDIEFEDMRPGDDRPENRTEDEHYKYDTTDLRGFVDTYDHVLWDEAKKIFERRLKMYNVTRENCPSACARPNDNIDH
mmetsp:Transcript_39499/g.113624  ORF Transcript_39499/g.113624 Transcript_39499/m.113624 type:complete len:361 (-) Transcript_39499:127-1209(-)